MQGLKEPSQRGVYLIRREDTSRRRATVCKGPMKKENLGLPLKTPSWWGWGTLLLFPSRSPWGSDGDAATVLCPPATITALPVSPVRGGAAPQW